MKREIITLIFLAILILPTILAESIIDSEEPDGLITYSAPDLSAIAGGLDKKTENVLKREIQIPELFQFVAKLIFGLKSDSQVTIEGLVVLLAVWMMFFVAIKEILKLTPFLNKGSQNTIGAIIITIIIATTGTVNILTIFLLTIDETFELLKTLGPFKILPIIGIILMASFAINYFTNQIKKDRLMAKSEDIGRNANAISRMGKSALED